MYSGLIIKESLADELLLDKLQVEAVALWQTDKKPKYWTAVSFTSDCEDFPHQLSQALQRSSESGMVWYVDMKDAVYKYIVLKDAVFKYHLGNEEEKKAVCESCLALGVAQQQLDWLE